MDLLFMHDLETEYIGHLENIGSLGYAALPNADTFISCTIPKIHFS